MDIAAFLAQAEDLFDGDPAAGAGPRDAAYVSIRDAVAGMTTANELAVLGLAASLLPSGEDYLEVGSYKGRSLCGAVATAPPTAEKDTTFHVVENYLEFGMLGQQARDELHRNLATHAAHVRVNLLEGDSFRVLTERERFPRDIGVYFYDGEHTGLAHWLALGVVEPLLADEALVLVDDATWPMVKGAHERWIARHPGWSVIRRWDAADNDDPHWANGLHALAFRRPSGMPRALHPHVRTALVAQRLVVGPARKAVWKTLHAAPWLVPLAKTLEPKKAHAISD